MPESRRRRRRRSQPETSSPNVFSRLIPDVVEKPVVAGISAAGGLVGNLATDVKDAVVGLPMGVVTIARDPDEALTAIGEATWQTWSPLFHGDIGKFGQQLYDHPLAPLLDVATVFTLGAGGVARGAGTLSKASGSRLDRIAGLRAPKQVDVLDPTDKGRMVKPRNLSTRAGRRIIQEGLIALEPHLPQWTQRGIQSARFNSRWAVQGAHAVAAKQLLVQHTLALGRAMDDPETAPRMRAEVAAGLYLNHNRHDAWIPLSEAAEIVRKNPKDYGIKKSAAALNPLYRRQLRALQSEERVLDNVRAANAEAAHSLSRVTEELNHARSELAAMKTSQHPVTAAVRAEERRIQSDIDATNDALREALDNGHIVLSPSKSKRKNPTARQLMEHEAKERGAGQQLLKLQQKELDSATGERLARISEQEALVKRLEDAQVKGELAQAQHETALSQLGELKNRRIEMERRSFAEYFAHAGETAEAFESFVLSYGRKIVARRPDQYAHPLRDGKSDTSLVQLVRKSDARKLGLEARNSSRAAQLLWRRPTHIWKLLQIGYTPRSLTNNAVGNAVIYALREGGQGGSARAVWSAMRHTFGRDKAGSDFLHATPFKKDSWLYRFYGDELGNVFGHDLMAVGGTGFKRRLQQGLYPLVHKLADEPVRVASLEAFLLRQPEVKALRRSGLSKDTAILRALKKTPGLRERGAEHARRTAGDYFTLRGPERFVRDLMPFYLWNRHIIRTTGNLFADTPGRLAVLQRVSNLGVEETEELLGDIPEFLRGAIPLEALGLADEIRGDRADVLLTMSLNPFATVGELAGLAEAFTTGTGPRGLSSALAGANPILTGGIEAVTGRSLLTGAPKPTVGGLPTSIAASAAIGLPFARLAEAATPVADGEGRLYQPDRRGPTTSFLGIPLRDVNLEKAAEIAAKEKPKPKTKNRRGGREGRRGRAN